MCTLIVHNVRHLSSKLGMSSKLIDVSCNECLPISMSRGKVPDVNINYLAVSSSSLQSFCFMLKNSMPEAGAHGVTQQGLLESPLSYMMQSSIPIVNDSNSIPALITHCVDSCVASQSGLTLCS